MHKKDGTMSRLNIRSATIENIDSLQSFSRLFGPKDYLIQAWGKWLEKRDAVNLIAEKDTRIIGCIHGELLTSIDGWAQALRVHPEFENMGIGKELLKALQAALESEGVTHVRSTIDAFNTTSQAIVKKFGWKTVDRVCRRRCKDTTSQREKILLATMAIAIEFVKAFPVLASQPHLSYVHRSYFRMNKRYLSELVKKRQCVYTPDLTAYAFIDLNSQIFPNSIWVTSLKGKTEGMKKILESLLDLAARLGIDLIADCPYVPSLQKQLDALGFDPPSPLGRFVIVECQLDEKVRK
jgi:N-acetylglutamate synthase-like GNAT family acetyltransferase